MKLLRTRKINNINLFTLITRIGVVSISFDTNSFKFSSVSTNVEVDHKIKKEVRKEMIKNINSMDIKFS